MTTNLLQIQIATALTEAGVGDIRWVLLDSSDGAEPSVTAPAAVPVAVEAVRVATATAPVPANDAAPAPMKAVEPESDPHADLTYQVLRALVLVAALTAAWWTASSMIEQRGVQTTAPSTAKAATP